MRPSLSTATNNAQRLPSTGTSQRPQTLVATRTSTNYARTPGTATNTATPPMDTPISVGFPCIGSVEHELDLNNDELNLDEIDLNMLPLARDSEAAPCQQMDDEPFAGLTGFTTPVPHQFSNVAEAWFAEPVPEPTEPAPAEDGLNFGSLSSTGVPAEPWPRPAQVAPKIEDIKISGPAPFERGPLQVHGVEPPNEHGHCRVVTHPTGKNVMYNKGSGYDKGEVDDIEGPPVEPDVVEYLELEVFDPTGAQPNEKAKCRPGDCFMGSPIRGTPLPTGIRNAAEQPAMGLNWWRIPGEANTFMFIVGEPPKGTIGKLDKGIARSAVWQLRYSQVKLNHCGEKVEELFARTIPGLLILRAESAQNAAKNAARKASDNVRKEKVISLLRSYGCTQKLTVKRGFGELLALATEYRVALKAVSAAVELSGPEVADKVGEFMRKKRRKC